MIGMLVCVRGKTGMAKVPQAETVVRVPARCVYVEVSSRGEGRERVSLTRPVGGAGVQGCVCVVREVVAVQTVLQNWWRQQSCLFMCAMWRLSCQR